MSVKKRLANEATNMNQARHRDTIFQSHHSHHHQHIHRHALLQHKKTAVVSAKLKSRLPPIQEAQKIENSKHKDSTLR